MNLIDFTDYELGNVNYGGSERKMRSKTTKGSICLDGPCGLVYRIGTISCTVFEDESFRYEFRPNWPVIDLLGPPEFQGVPGFDLDAHKDVYVRENITPTFVSERAPSENREGLWQMLEDAGMDHLDKIEWLVRTDTHYIGDSLYVRAIDEAGSAADVPAELPKAINDAQNSLVAELAILRRLSSGEPVELDGRELGTEARRALHATLRALLEKSYAYREARRKASGRGAHAGRKRKAVDGLLLAETLDMYEKGMLNPREAAMRLDVSQATFFRRLKERRNADGEDGAS